MKIKYEIFDERGYDAFCSYLDKVCSIDSSHEISEYMRGEYIREYTKTGTGEIVGFIKGWNFFNFFKKPDMFLIADDKTGNFIKVNVSDCKNL